MSSRRLAKAHLSSSRRPRAERAEPRSRPVAERVARVKPGSRSYSRWRGCRRWSPLWSSQRKLGSILIWLWFCVSSPRRLVSFAFGVSPGFVALSARRPHRHPLTAPPGPQEERRASCAQKQEQGLQRKQGSTLAGVRLNIAGHSYSRHSSASWSPPRPRGVPPTGVHAPKRKRGAGTSVRGRGSVLHRASSAWDGASRC